MVRRYLRNMNGIVAPDDAEVVDDEILILRNGVYRKKPHIRIEGVVHKHCEVCNEWKPLDKFFANKSRWDGRNNTCRKCYVPYFK